MIGTPLTINAANVWRGQDRTNGFVMKNIDGRIPALKESFSRLNIGAASVLYAPGVVPFGNALFRDNAVIDVSPGAVQSDKPTKARFQGVLQFEQGIQTGHPVQNWGIMTFSKGTLVRKGLVGYKQAMTAVLATPAAQEANYLALLGGDKAKDVVATRTTYAEWIAAQKAGADGDKLGLFFANTSGFPIVQLVLAANINNPTAGFTNGGVTFGGWAEIFEKENQAIYFDIQA